MTKILGLTGGIATGKSTVAKMFQDANVPLIDTDLIAKEVLQIGQVGYLEVLQHFGEEILLTNKEINRKKLGRLIFNNPKKRKLLNHIVHPRVEETVKYEIERHKKLQTPIIVIDVPLLYESGFDQYVDEVIVVFTQRDLQIERLISRDNISEEYAQMKINSQMSLEDKMSKGDYVIDNSKSILETKKQFNEILEKLR